MGQYNKDDFPNGGANAFLGEERYDCPDENDSLIVGPASLNGLGGLIKKINDAEYQGQGTMDGTPDLIVDAQGNIQANAYKQLFGKEFNPEKIMYSHGKETLASFWERESYRFVPLEREKDPNDNFSQQLLF